MAVCEKKMRPSIPNRWQSSEVEYISKFKLFQFFRNYWLTDFKPQLTKIHIFLASALFEYAHERLLVRKPRCSTDNSSNKKDTQPISCFCFCWWTTNVETGKIELLEKFGNAHLLNPSSQCIKKNVVGLPYLLNLNTIYVSDLNDGKYVKWHLITF